MPQMTDMAREQLIRELSESHMTLEKLGKKYGITRERVRQIAWNCLGLAWKERCRVRTTENKFEAKRGMYPEHVAAVWHEAARRGFTVRGWIHSELIMGALFINSRRVRVLHVNNAMQPSKWNKTLYGHARISFIDQSHIIVLDNKIDGQRYFYIFPRELKSLRKHIYIPLSTARKRRTSTDWTQYKDAWHLLAAPKEQAEGTVAA